MESEEELEDLVFLGVKKTLFIKSHMKWDTVLVVRNANPDVATRTSRN